METENQDIQMVLESIQDEIKRIHTRLDVEFLPREAIEAIIHEKVAGFATSSDLESLEARQARLEVFEKDLSTRIDKANGNIEVLSAMLADIRTVQETQGETIKNELASMKGIMGAYTDMAKQSGDMFKAFAAEMRSMNREMRDEIHDTQKLATENRSQIADQQRVSAEKLVAVQDDVKEIKRRDDERRARWAAVRSFLRSRAGAVVVGVSVTTGAEILRHLDETLGNMQELILAILRGG